MKIKGKPAAASFAAVLAMLGAIGGGTAKLEGMRLQAYQDVAGVWTICMGHATGVHQGQRATLAQCRAYMTADQRTAFDAVDRCIHADVTVGEAAAFTDAAYNIGPAVVCGSTLQRLANAGDQAGACAQLLRWDKARVRGVLQRIAGLYYRRDAEYQVCTQGLSV